MVLQFYTKNFKSFQAKMKAWRQFESENTVDYKDIFFIFGLKYKTKPAPDIARLLNFI